MKYREAEDSTFIHNGKRYSVNWLLDKAERSLVHEVPVSAFAWCVYESNLNPHRVRRANIEVPVIYTIDRDSGYTILDGTHRLMKAMQEGYVTIKAKHVPAALFYGNNNRID